MARNRNRLLALLALAAVAALAVLAFTQAGGSDDDTKAEQTQATTSLADVPKGHDGSSKAERKVTQTWLKKQGWQRKEYCFRLCIKPNLTAGSNAVSDEAIRSVGELRTWLQSGEKDAQAYLAAVGEHVSKHDLNRIKRGEGFVRVQMKVPAEQLGTSYTAPNGQVTFTDEGRKVDAGDISFMFVSERKVTMPNGQEQTKRKVKEEASTRGGCGNPNTVLVPVGSPPSEGPPREGPPSEGPPREGPPTEERHPVVTDDDIGKDDPHPEQEGSEHGNTHRQIEGGGGNPPPAGEATPEPGTGGGGTEGAVPPAGSCTGGCGEAAPPSQPPTESGDVGEGDSGGF
ncbi:MAG TPA: hypothetical protein VIF43_01725 [Patescibacteria group bacterium]|jgi:hypothetical protein